MASQLAQSHAPPLRLLLAVTLGVLAILGLSLLDSGARASGKDTAAVLAANRPGRGPAIAAPLQISDTTPTVTPTPTDTVQACSDLYEPDDSPQDAVCSFLMDGHSEDHTFHVPNDVDYFKIEAIAGTTYTLTTFKLLSVTDTIMHLYKADAVTQVAVNDDIHWPDNIASQIVWTATYNGMYYARVRDFFWRGDCLGYSITGKTGPRFSRRYLPLMQVPAPTPTFTLTPTPVDTPTSTPTPTETDTPTITPTPMDTPTSTPTPTETDTPTITLTPTETDTPTITPTPSNTPTAGPIALPTIVSVPGLVYPSGLALDPTTHRVYIASWDTNRVIALDGVNLGTVNDTLVGSQPWGMVVNPTTRKLYVANFGSSDVYVLNADTLARIGRVQLSTGTPAELTFIALNPLTNRVFVVSHAYNQLIVINGDTDVVERKVGTGGFGSWGLAVNPNLNRVYVGQRDSNGVVTFDGNANYERLDAQTITACGDRGSPFSLAFNPANDKLYMSCAALGDVNTAVVLAASTSGLAQLAWLPIASGGKDGGGGIAVDATTGNAFFTNAASNSVSVVSGASDTVTDTVAAGANPFPIVADPGTQRIFAGDRDANTIYVLPDAWLP